MGLSAEIERILRTVLPTDMHGHAGQLAAVLDNLVRASESNGRYPASTPDPSLLGALAGRALRFSDAQIVFGPGAQTGDVTIGNVAGRDVVTVNIYTGELRPATPFVHRPATLYLSTTAPASPQVAGLARRLRLRGLPVASTPSTTSANTQTPLESAAVCLLHVTAARLKNRAAFDQDVKRIRDESQRRHLPVLVLRDSLTTRRLYPSLRPDQLGWVECEVGEAVTQLDQVAAQALQVTLLSRAASLINAGVLDMGFYTGAPSNPDAIVPALSLNWSELYAPQPPDPGPVRYPPPDEWRELLLPALDDLRFSLGHTSLRCINLFAFARLAACVALGYSFRSVAGLQFRLRQGEGWWETAPHNSSLQPLDLVPLDATGDSPDLILELNVTSPRGKLSRDVSHYLETSGLAVGQRIALERPPPIGNQIDAADAQAIASQVRTVLQQYSRPGGVNHLFMAAPFGLALMIGWHLNTLTPVQCYELPQGGGAYLPACRIT